jgi:hypothetical protein
VSDDEPLDESAEAKKITWHVDDLERHGLLPGVRASMEALSETVQSVVTVKESRSGG